MNSFDIAQQLAQANDPNLDQGVDQTSVIPQGSVTSEAPVGNELEAAIPTNVDTQPVQTEEEEKEDVNIAQPLSSVVELPIDKLLWKYQINL